jgi:hypothetical protein
MKFFFISIVIFSLGCNTKDKTNVKLKNNLLVDSSKLKDNYINKINYNDFDFMGVLSLNSEKLINNKDTIFIFNKDNSIFDELYFDIELNELVLKKNKKIEIKDFYLDYLIVNFLSNKKENYYEVLVDNEIKLIKFQKDLLLFENWTTHILNCFTVLDKNKIIYKLPNLESEKIEIKDINNFNFEIIDVKDDWIKIKCNENCEGCYQNIKVEGWIKWRNNKKLLIKLFYSC